MNILIPADFSMVSVNAIRFAYDMANKKDQLKVVHVSQGTLSPSNYYNPVMAGLNLVPALKKKMTQLICEALKTHNLPSNIDVEITIGEVVGEVKDMAQNDDFDFIVVGSRDKADLVDRWIGTVALGIVKTNNIPVFLIPANSSYDGFKKTIIATDHKLQNADLLEMISEWNKDHHSFLSFLHVHDQTNGEEAIHEEIVKSFYEKKQVDFSFEIKTIISGDVSGSLLAQAYEENADLLIAAPNNHGFFHTLMFRNISKDLVLKSKIPVLFLHTKPKA